jgi:hypothetical protein
MTLPVSFNEFKKNPVAAVTFCMLAVVAFLYYDSISTRKEIIADCKKISEAQALKLESLERQVKKSDSLVAVYSYECKFYLQAIEGYNDVILAKKK